MAKSFSWFQKVTLILGVMASRFIQAFNVGPLQAVSDNPNNTIMSVTSLGVNANSHEVAFGLTQMNEGHHSSYLRFLNSFNDEFTTISQQINDLVSNFAEVDYSNEENSNLDTVVRVEFDEGQEVYLQQFDKHHQPIGSSIPLLGETFEQIDSIDLGEFSDGDKVVTLTTSQNNSQYLSNYFFDPFFTLKNSDVRKINFNAPAVTTVDQLGENVMVVIGEQESNSSFDRIHQFVYNMFGNLTAENYLLTQLGRFEHFAVTFVPTSDNTNYAALVSAVTNFDVTPNSQLIFQLLPFNQHGALGMVTPLISANSSLSEMYHRNPTIVAFKDGSNKPNFLVSWEGVNRTTGEVSILNQEMTMTGAFQGDTFVSSGNLSYAMNPKNIVLSSHKILQTFQNVNASEIRVDSYFVTLTRPENNKPTTTGSFALPPEESKTASIILLSIEAAMTALIAGAGLFKLTQKCRETQIQEIEMKEISSLSS